MEENTQAVKEEKAISVTVETEPSTDERLKNLEELAKKQTKYAKRAMLGSWVRAIALVAFVAIALVTAVSLITVLGGVADRVNDVADEITELSETANDSIVEAGKALSLATDTIDELDVEGMNAAISGIADVDFQKLNDSIASLQVVVSNMEQLFSFGR